MADLDSKELSSLQEVTVVGRFRSRICLALAAFAVTQVSLRAQTFLGNERVMREELQGLRGKLTQSARLRRCNDELLSIIDRMAGLYEGLKRFSDAERLWLVSVGLREETARSLQQRKGLEEALAGLANTYDLEHKYDKAEVVHRKRIELAKAVYGPRSGEVALALDMYGSCLENEGKNDKALASYEQALEIYTNTEGATTALTRPMLIESIKRLKSRKGVK